MHNPFIQIAGSKRSLHVQVAREIARKILSGEAAQNEIIPSEMGFSYRFKVSSLLRDEKRLHFRCIKNIPLATREAHIKRLRRWLKIGEFD